jgi:hypothetical protein
MLSIAKSPLAPVRVRLVLDRVQERSPAGGNFLAVCGATAASISSLAR